MFWHTFTTGQAWKWGMWIRIWYNGPGLCVMRDKPVLFSERNGHRKVRRMGRWSFEVLKSTTSGGL